MIRRPPRSTRTDTLFPYTTLFRSDGRWQDVPLQPQMTLSPDEHEFIVRARLLAYDDPGSNRYWSKLEGFDTDWVQQGAVGERSFTGLPAGKYTLRLRAADAAAIGRPSGREGGCQYV